MLSPWGHWTATWPPASTELNTYGVQVRPWRTGVGEAGPTSCCDMGAAGRVSACPGVLHPQRPVHEPGCGARLRWVLKVETSSSGEQAVTCGFKGHDL